MRCSKVFRETNRIVIPQAEHQMPSLPRFKYQFYALNDDGLLAPLCSEVRLCPASIVRMAP